MAGHPKNKWINVSSGAGFIFLMVQKVQALLWFSTKLNTTYFTSGLSNTFLRGLITPVNHDWGEFRHLFGNEIFFKACNTPIFFFFFFWKKLLGDIWLLFDKISFRTKVAFRRFSVRNIWQQHRQQCIWQHWQRRQQQQRWSNSGREKKLKTSRPCLFFHLIMIL